jgi:Na(+)-translocating NADH:ubiquinone oxidoreductase C subunit
LERDGDLLLIVLPVYGSGYASTIRAMLALEPDLSTVAALTITEQGETPGLGARITEPDWQAQWPGKELLNDQVRDRHRGGARPSRNRCTRWMAFPAPRAPVTA